MTTAAEFVELKGKLEQYEGIVEHMYLDGKGLVTVGVGHMMPSADTAAGLSFWLRKTGAPATAEQIKAEYDVISREQKGKLASYYKSKTTLFMKQEDIDVLTKEHISSFERELKNLYSVSAYPPGFEKFPDEVRLALFDMIFNLGATKMRKMYLSFNQAILKADWEKAGAQSARQGIQLARNEYVKALFKRAADAKKAAGTSTTGTSVGNAP